MIKKKKGLYLGILFGIIFLVFANTTTFYKSPVGKISKVTTKKGNEAKYDKNDLNAEAKYEQKLKIKIKNGSYKNKTITLNNSYSYSRVNSIRYKKGDQVFLNIAKDQGLKQVKVVSLRRDYYGLGLVLILIYLLLMIGKKRGVLSLISLFINTLIFVLCLPLFSDSQWAMEITCILMVVFTLVTLFIANGFHLHSLAAVLSTFISAAVTVFIFLIARKFGGDIDYSTLDYLTGDLDYELLFLASVAIAGLGAIMDVSISIAAVMNELITKNSNISVKKLFLSGKEVGHDIMGTMTNVLLFTYVCGIIPLTLIKMKNEIRLLSIIRLQIPFEISRFLIGGIGIILSIPISIGVSILLLKVIGRRKR
ncbi:MAG TPA: YibE/F family protein [Candidatus Dorea intestinavium]|nr:YibE/F family protein [Candidatus Dorea intestinavium]